MAIFFHLCKRKGKKPQKFAHSYLVNGFNDFLQISMQFPLVGGGHLLTTLGINQIKDYVAMNA